jgi:hypothetical protein
MFFRIDVFKGFNKYTRKNLFRNDILPGYPRYLIDARNVSIDDMIETTVITANVTALM